MSSMDLLNKARRLEMENQRLAALLSSSSAKESGLRGDSGEKIVQLEGECARLRLRLADMEEERRTKDGQAAEKVEAAASRVAIADKERQELQRVNLEQKNAIENLKVSFLFMAPFLVYFNLFFTFCSQNYNHLGFSLKK